MKSKHKLITYFAQMLIAVWFMGYSPLHAQSVSSVSGSFIDIGYGARASGMGFAYTGLAEGADAVIWNPAGLGQAETMDFSVMHVNQYNMVNYDYVGGVIPILNDQHRIGFALLTSGDDLLREHALYTAYSFNYQNLYVGGALKFRLNSFGNNTLRPDDYIVFEPDEITSVFNQQIQGSGFGLGIDLGVLYKITERVQLGLTLRDAYAPFWWDSETAGASDVSAKGSYEEGIPMELVLGGAYNFQGRTIITTDFIPTLSDGTSDALRVGAEHTFIDIISIRAGLEERFRKFDLDQYTFGFSLKSPELYNISIAAHYAYVINDFNNSHRVGLQVQIF